MTIKRKKIDPVRLNGAEPRPLTKKEISELAVDLPEEVIRGYEKALNPKLPFLYRVRKFMAAESAAGRKAKIVKDAVLFFAPFGRQVSTASEFITGFIKPQSQSNPVSLMKWILNRLKEKSTWRGLVVALTGLGLSLSAEQQQAIIALGVSLFVAIEILGKEPQSDDAEPA